MGSLGPDEPNHVFRSPCDILHTFGCGLCKTVALWSISVVMLVSKCKGFVHSKAILDSRIASFKDLPKLPNVTQTYFLKGVCFLNKNKSSADKCKSTGGAGGFRSCEFVPLLLQMYLAIGFNGDILPTTNTFYVAPDIQVGNITKVVQSAILNVLDAYFCTQISPLTADRIVRIQDKMMKCSHHFIALFQLLDKCSGRADPRLPITRKLHASCCNITPFMNDFGTFDKACTASWESCHRYSTVGIWYCTSRRYDTQNSEMANQAMLLNYNVINDFIAAVNSNTLEAYIKKNGPYVAPEEVEVQALNNYQSFPLTIDHETDMLTGDEDFLTLIKGGHLNVALLSGVVQTTMGERAWNSLKRRHLPTRLTCVQAISIEGNTESRLGKIILYATHKFRHRRPRYDKVLVQLQENEFQPAQLMAMFMMTNHDESHINYFAMVRYFVEVDNKEAIHRQYECPFPIYMWELGPYIGRRRLTVTQLINIDTVIGPAFMPPVISKTLPSPRSQHPRPTDRFWYVDRKYCDRAGWDDIQKDEQTAPTTHNEEEGNLLHIDIPDLHDIDINDPGIYVDNTDDEDEEQEDYNDEDEDEEDV
jgi:hypothetical protein